MRDLVKINPPIQASAKLSRSGSTMNGDRWSPSHCSRGKTKGRKWRWTSQGPTARECKLWYSDPGTPASLPGLPYRLGLPDPPAPPPSFHPLSPTSAAWHPPPWVVDASPRGFHTLSLVHPIKCTAQRASGKSAMLVTCGTFLNPL